MVNAAVEINHLSYKLGALPHVCPKAQISVYGLEELKKRRSHAPWRSVAEKPGKTSWKNGKMEAMKHEVTAFVCRTLKYSFLYLLLQIPPTAELPGTAFQQNIPTYRQGEDPIIQNCSCVRCFAVRRTRAGPATWHPVEPQDPRNFGVSKPL